MINPYEHKELYEALRPLVADFELSCLLRHAGVPQKSALYWHLPKIFADHKDKNRMAYLSTEPTDAHCSAFTSEELGVFLDAQYCTVRVGKAGYVFVDLMACSFRPLEQPVEGQKKLEGGGLVLQMVRGAEDKTEVHCRARAIILLEGKKVLQFSKDVRKN